MTLTEAAAVTLGSLKGAAFDDAVKAFRNDQLEAMMGLAKNRDHNPDMGEEWSIRQHGVQPTLDILNAAASSADPTGQTQARVFAAGVQAMKNIGKICDGQSVPFFGPLIQPMKCNFLDNPPGQFEAEKADAPRIYVKNISNALTNLVNKDATRMMSALMKNDPKANALVGYLKVKVENKDYADIGNIIAKLKHGNDLKEIDRRFLGLKRQDENGENVYINAMHLGHFLGATTVAIKQAASVKKEQIGMAQNIVDTALWAATTSAHEFVQAKAAGSTGATNTFAQRAMDRIDGNAEQWIQGLVSLAEVTNPATGEVDKEIGWRKDFGEGYNDVMRYHPL